MNEGEDEKILLVVHKHWASLALDAFVVIFPGILVALLLIFSRASTTGVDIAAHTILTLLVPLCFLIIWIVLSVVWTMHYLSALVVTDRRVFYTEQQGLANSTINEWNIDGLQTSASISGILQSFFHYGTVVLKIPGQETVEVPDIPDPEQVSAVILKQYDRLGELQDTTRKQEELLKFLSHEVKGHLTKSKAMFASIVEGDFGPVAAPLGSMAQTALADSEKGVETIMSILDDSNAKSGDITIRMQPFDFSTAVRRAVEELRTPATAKHLSIVCSIEDGCVVNGDEEKIMRHVIRNLIDNAIRYTPAGQIDVVVERANDMARLSVSDTGVGIDEYDLQKLFTEGGHGEHSRDVNPESTGYGLFVAKQIVDKHSGRIWARSAGGGRGSTFFAEFPLLRA